MKILISGWPGTGKTTLANSLGGGRSTDETIDMSWSEGSQEVSRWLDKPGPWIIEGVVIPRALRKWHEHNPGRSAPVDRFIYVSVPRKLLSPGQMTMGLGLDTVLNEIRPWLEETVEIEIQ